jgi:hypothetical protein
VIRCASLALSARPLHELAEHSRAPAAGSVVLFGARRRADHAHVSAGGEFGNDLGDRGPIGHRQLVHVAWGGWVLQRLVSSALLPRGFRATRIDRTVRQSRPA